jgi:UDP-N-acetylmuramyl pentapeptide phosphotransferase/UDP-N-acetylglucosamine-1-phosphate transferase
MSTDSLVLFAIIGSIASFLLCYLGTSFLVGYLKKRKMTVLDYHKVEKTQVPRPAGPAIVASIAFGELILFVASGSFAVLGLILVTTVSGVVGIFDDLKTLGGIVKPALLLIGGVPLIVLEYFIPNSNVFSHHLFLPLFKIPTNLPVIYILLVLIALPVVTNTVNTIDVLNGVVTGFMIIACVPVALAISLRVFLGLSDPIILIAMGPLFASLVAFYIFHRYPSKIFPGDSGALAIGGAFGGMAIIGGVEIVAIVAILPAILNSFLFLSSMKRLVEHREIKDQPVVVYPDAKMTASNNPKAPVTLVRMLVAGRTLSEDQIVNEIFKLAIFSAVLAIITALLTWGVTIA